jgi:uncharacterized protein (TIGR03086 family)
VDPLCFLASASETFHDRIASVSCSEWAGGSTCTEWTVRDVLDHVVGGNRFAVASLDGLPLEEAFTSALSLGFDGEPVDLYSVSAADQLRAFGTSNALMTMIDHPMGQISGLEFLGYRICDLVLHSWDIARSTGGAERIDDDLVEFVWTQMVDGTGSVLESGSYGTHQPLDDDRSVTTMDRVLLASGRTP